MYHTSDETHSYATLIRATYGAVQRLVTAGQPTSIRWNEFHRMDTAGPSHQYKGLRQSCNTAIGDSGYAGVRNPPQPYHLTNSKDYMPAVLCIMNWLYEEIVAYGRHVYIITLTAKI